LKDDSDDEKKQRRGYGTQKPKDDSDDDKRQRRGYGGEQYGRNEGYGSKRSGGGNDY